LGWEWCGVERGHLKVAGAGWGLGRLVAGIGEVECWYILRRWAGRG
jgi:hypothetical protein